MLRVQASWLPFHLVVLEALLLPLVELLVPVVPLLRRLPPRKKRVSRVFGKLFEEHFANTIYREGRIRRGYGFWPFRLNNQLLGYGVLLSAFQHVDTGLWKELSGLYVSGHGS